MPHPPALPHPLDNPAYSALTGPHAHLAERCGRVLRYPVDVSPWLALPTDPRPDDWADVAALAGPGASIHFPGVRVALPSDWEVTGQLPGAQYVDDGVDAAFDGEAKPLTPADVPQMLDLVARTEPGPFLPRSILLGDYLGVWRDGRLVAMAGERLHPPGWTEISAVCTDQEYRGQGLATRLVRAVAAGIRARGETPFLHVAMRNTGARALYESLGFRQRRPAMFRTARVPEHLPEARAVEAV
ncbi:GNAT family N-acetyltransferase [Streptomyces odontomachi]|uniref:GNAT family N-acetyltransferase n=1 Tax=Streptomyces odontomachi TaxID=2944940 RepID=UPI00210C8379|nr:GNAT family N-acetyltransferase [Streptomyces sp. ODS25]